MCPVLTLFGLQIPAYRFFAGLGIIAVCFFCVFRMERVQMSFLKLFAFLACTTLSVLICSKLLYVIACIPEHGFTAKSLLHDLFHGGIVFYGGMLGVLLACVLFSLIEQKTTHDLMDFAAPAIALFHAFARLGCLFAGCCYGKPWSFGVTNHAFPGEVLFPTQLLEVICNILIFAGILIMQRVRETDWGSIEVYLVSYGICRFLLEFFRGDTIRGIWADGLSTSQHISLIIILVVIIKCLLRRGRNSLCE